MSDLATLDALSTEELRDRAFSSARKRGDIGFFWNLIERLPSARDTESNDESLGSVGSSIEEVVGLWRELTGHEYGEQEPLIRAAFIDYLLKHPA
ncbi:hypothetical protein [Cryptosporangium aurantiacum]|uniref:Uncharacterized protein n=1 Tax=Cryptosporangium aurantiacum TaxID=134849 RepID=A0A1M7NC20_9ACTN|nr:hypothetical protein [Cryptosporangium aurantiacum]SHN01200.1 hypothetical protein SAMN05443668_102536 [Cryptosporangium aurantiacum]